MHGKSARGAQIFGDTPDALSLGPGPVLSRSRLRPPILIAGAILVISALAYRPGSTPLLDDPNDGQYAEVAREMLESGDWISPHLNGVLFLNKPPLLYWLIASSYALFGINEAAARLPGILTTIVTVLLLHRLGTTLFDRRTGALAACLYAALPSTWIEARFVRPDTLLVASCTASVLALLCALRTEGEHRRRALYALQISLALGTLAKGVVALVLPGLVLIATLWADRRWEFLHQLTRGRSWIPFLALLAPWHVAAGLEHPGFLWDYVINQHVLFFFDLKLPRDSIPIDLESFWAAFSLRVFPWTLLAPLVVFQAARRGRDLRSAHFVLLVWAALVLLFFSAAASRLEHYALPALPPLALLIAAFLREGRGRTRRLVGLHFVLLAVLLAISAWKAPALFQENRFAALPELSWIAVIFFGATAIGAGAAALLSRRSCALAGFLFCFTGLALTPCLHEGLARMAPRNSSAPLVDFLFENAPADVPIVYQAPTEYQSCAGLNFYLRRNVLLLRPAGFVEPTYLVPYRDRLFLPLERLAELWDEEQLVVVTNPLAPAEHSWDGTVPEPRYTLGRFGNRWLITNRAP